MWLALGNPYTKGLLGGLQKSPWKGSETHVNTGSGCNPSGLGNTSVILSAIFKGGLAEGGEFHTPIRGTMFFTTGTLTSGPSRESDITLFDNC